MGSPCSLPIHSVSGEDSKDLEASPTPNPYARHGGAPRLSEKLSQGGQPPKVTDSGSNAFSMCLAPCRQSQPLTEHSSQTDAYHFWSAQDSAMGNLEPLWSGWDFIRAAPLPESLPTHLSFPPPLLSQVADLPTLWRLALPFSALSPLSFVSIAPNAHLTLGICFPVDPTNTPSDLHLTMTWARNHLNTLNHWNIRVFVTVIRLHWPVTFLTTCYKKPEIQENQHTWETITERWKEFEDRQKRLGEKVERSYAVHLKFVPLSFRTLTSNQNSRDVTRYNSDLLHWVVFIPSVPLRPQRAWLQTGVQYILAGRNYCCIQTLLVDTAWNKSNRSCSSVPKSLLTPAILSFSHSFPRLMDRPSASISLQRARLSILDAEKNWHFCILPEAVALNSWSAADCVIWGWRSRSTHLSSALGKPITQFTKCFSKTGRYKLCFLITCQ